MQQSSNSAQREQSTASIPTTRRPYRAPRLRTYGDVVALTKNMACGGNDGPAGKFLS